MKYLVALIMLSVNCGILAQTQTITGKIKAVDEMVSFAKVDLVGTDYGTITNENGEFELQNIPPGKYHLRIRAVGYIEKIIPVEVADKQIELVTELEETDLFLNEVVVTGTMRETMVKKSPVKIEVINSSFFRSNPVNSVIEALNNVNGVQEQVNCAVCGTNDIHINGMEGPYTLVLIDGMSIISGLSSVYGFNGIPTSLIDRVEIVKGPSSTLYGTEAVGGVINIITKSPEECPLIDLESNFTTHQELKSSLGITPRLGKQVYTTISADYYYNNHKMDFNEDNFTDIPLNNRLSIFNKWLINNKEGLPVVNLAARYYMEDRFGGTLQWTPDDLGSDETYGESITTRRLEIIGSYYFPVKNRNLKLDISANNHDQDAWYGNVNYRANQKILFSNLIWNKSFNNRNHLIIGLTNKFQTYADNTTSETDEQTYVPGIFCQDEFNWTEKFTVLGGARLDYHSAHGLIFSPRLSMKYQVGHFTALRLNYGNGFRQVQLFTEDHAFFSGSRAVMLMEKLRPERSHNATLNLNHTYTWMGCGNIDVDFFYTYYLNKILPDYDYDPQLIVYDNLQGYGVTQGASVSLHHSFNFPLKVRIGGTYLNTYQMVEDENGIMTKEIQVFTPAFSGTFGVSYDFKKIGLTLNYTGKVMGPQVLPTYPEEYNIPEVSPWFTLQNFQITKSFKHNIEMYTGVRNIFNYTQPSPLIDSGDPFGDNFDTSYAYGPLQVRRFFFGIRWKLDRRDMNPSTTNVNNNKNNQ
ncbi:MAG: TonB-dependent receptor [Crocinitomicaceae bacterium]|nr:TonB-dependent receptor [Crocinitomicaceae bacterium]